jgi:hypothetical protein
LRDGRDVVRIIESAAATNDPARYPLRSVNFFRFCFVDATQDISMGTPGNAEKFRNSYSVSLLLTLTITHLAEAADTQNPSASLRASSLVRRPVAHPKCESPATAKALFGPLSR